MRTLCLFVAAATARALSAPSPLRMPRLGPPDRKITYSNPQGATLTQIRPNAWLGERPFYPRIPGLGGVDVACKMAVVRLRDGSLWVHAPVALDAATRAAVDALGPVKHIVTPNTEHLKWARDWIAAYPGATAYACPGLRERRPDIGFSADIGDDPPREWGGEFRCAWMEHERPPLGLAAVLGDRPFFSEVVFCHEPSKVLFVTDLWWNYPAGDDVPLGSRLWKVGMDRIYGPVYNSLMKREGWDAKIARVFSKEWDWDYLAPCHGNPVQEDARAVLAGHLRVQT